MKKKKSNFYRRYIGYPDLEMEFQGKHLTMIRDVVGTNEVAEYMKAMNVIFAVGNVGCELEWVPKESTFEFWKCEAKPRIIEPDMAEDGFSPEEFQNGYCYLASEWRINENEDNMCFILLTVFH